MHIPDQVLTCPVTYVTGAAALGAVGFSLHRMKRSFPREKAALFAAAGAFVFAAQMLNAPVDVGTSGHFLGAAFATILFGPGAGIVLLSLVLAVQALLFCDGGVLALGTNVFNMGILGCLSAWCCYRCALLGQPSLLRKLAAVGVASLIGVLLPALACSLELWASGHASLAMVVPSMLAAHAKIGVGEALLTVITLAPIHLFAPTVLAQPAEAALSKGSA